MISVLILTRNEEVDLPGCLDSVAWSDDVHVLDSMSTDRTVEIATAQGAKVTRREFDGYSSQRNAGLALPFQHDWIFILDADERPTRELSEEMQRAVLAAPESTCGFKMRRRDYLWGQWLKQAQITPYYIRLVRRGRARYVREINEVLEVDGAVGDLGCPLEHYPFSKGMTHWFSKHNQYSSMEAELIHKRQVLEQPTWRSALLHPDFHMRRLHQKALFYRMPARPLIKWLYMMFVRGAVLDGPAGVTYSTLQAIYEYMIVVKTRELTAKNPPATKN